MAFVEVANSFLVSLFAHLEAVLDVLSITLVAQITFPIVFFQILQQRVGKIQGLLTA